MKSFRLHLFAVPLLILGVIGIIGGVLLLQGIQRWVIARGDVEIEWRLNNLSHAIDSGLPDATIEAMDRLADLIGAGDPIRITIIDEDGAVLGDSSLSVDQVFALDNHLDRPEVVAASATGTGVSTRFSNSMKVDFRYIANRHQSPTFDGYLRASMPMNELQSMVAQQKSVISMVGIVMLVTAILFSIFAARYLSRLANAPLLELENRVRERTREIEQIQNFCHMMTACETVEEIGECLSSAGKSLSGTASGALAILKPSLNQLDVVAEWGTDQASSTSYSPKDCWGLRRGQIHVSDAQHEGLRCKHGHPSASEICIPLVAQGTTLGVLHIAGSHDEVANANTSATIDTLAENIGLSLANIGLRESLQFQAIRDPLTGLFNRRYLEESLNQEVQRALRKDGSFGVMMVDVDHFKDFNTNFGHKAGDYVLREIASIMAKSMRGEDIACRYGGEEFTLINVDSEVDVTVRRAEEVLERIRSRTFEYGGQSIGFVTVSIGVSSFPESGETVDELLAAADRALFIAKENGRDQVHSAVDPSMARIPATVANGETSAE